VGWLQRASVTNVQRDTRETTRNGHIVVNAPTSIGDLDALASASHASPSGRVQGNLRLLQCLAWSEQKPPHGVFAPYSRGTGGRGLARACRVEPEPAAALEPVTRHARVVTEVSQAASRFRGVCNAITQALMRQLLRDDRSRPDRGRAPVSLRSRPRQEAPTVYLPVCNALSEAAQQTQDCNQGQQGRGSLAETVVPQPTPHSRAPGLQCPAATSGVLEL